MRKIFSVSLFFIGIFTYSQDAKTQILENIGILEKALIENDTLVLQKLLHSDLTFGHSNAWTETKESLLNDLKNTKVVYTSFENISTIDFTFSSNQIAITRRKINAHGRFIQYDFSIKMNVLEVWIFDQNNWKLLARQSVGTSE